MAYLKTNKYPRVPNLDCVKKDNNDIDMNAITNAFLYHVYIFICVYALLGDCGAKVQSNTRI